MWPQSPQTEQLIANAKAGDHSAVNQLMDRHRNSLNHLVRMRLDKKVQNRVDVSDVVQDVLVEANRRLQRYLETPVMPFHLWLRQIAKDRIIDAHRRHRVSAKRSVDREQQLFAPGGHDQSSIQLASLLGDSKITPAAAALQKELAKKIEHSISQLEERDSEIIIMRHYEHLTNQEISKILNLSEPAASMRYLRAIRRLRELMQPEGISQTELN
ncbi:MAG: sigma-70 family RNA polymerase sigma factor [Mariniblastus sp.]|jgi:RNA polymerase sigma-70 factor, ECF subfamily|nr:sigma-70 family RNA polymerase sigma factor [Mariniblastus sp.]MDC0265632.1 sigma-70 family RNA polymerase sigma factor [Mariniblastus sp.]MDG1511346.1 sigma-70 family RNA polymerase sigma factor [Mariniblastus sp.]MDG2180758.1 sigma-70 family RNA polymerase sigma factor [Mariniblastus sp.]